MCRWERCGGGVRGGVLAVDDDDDDAVDVVDIAVGEGVAAGVDVGDVGGVGGMAMLVCGVRVVGGLLLFGVCPLVP